MSNDIDIDQFLPASGGVNIQDIEAVPFQPSQETIRAMPYKGQVGDRYLYRIYDPDSRGYTSEYTAMSGDVCRNDPECSVDVFARTDRAATAEMIFRHFEGMKRYPQRSDNLVSWTSSLLFALRYGCYRSIVGNKGGSLKDIELCIIDTNEFVEGSFMRDLDLMAGFASTHSGLAAFSRLRARKHDSFTGVYYFGEYLSQGKLSLKNKSRVVPISKMVDMGLAALRPVAELYSFSDGMLLRKVIVERERWYSNSRNGQVPSLASSKEIQAAVRIGKLFGPAFKMPVALSLLSLQPRREADEMIMECFTGLGFRAFELEQLAPSETTITDCNGHLPELTQFVKLAKAVYIKHCFDQAKSDARDVRERLESLSSVIKTLPLPSSWKSDLLRADEDEMSAEMRDIQMLADQLFDL